MDPGMMDGVDDLRTTRGFADVDNVMPLSALRKPPAGWKEKLPSAMPELGSELLGGFLRRLPDAPVEAIAFVSRLAHLGKQGLERLSFIDYLALCAEFPGTVSEPPPAEAKDFSRDAAVSTLSAADAAARASIAPLVETLKGNAKASAVFLLATPGRERVSQQNAAVCGAPCASSSHARWLCGICAGF